MSNNSLVHNAFYNMMYRILGIIFPVVTASYVARILLPEGVGRVNVAQNNVSYFVMIISLGIQTYGIREIAKCKNSIEKRSLLFKELLILNECCTLISLMVFIILLFLFPLFSNDFLLYSICGLAIVVNFFNFDWLYQGLEDYKYITVRSFWIKTLSLLLTFLFVKNETDIYKYALIQVFSVGGNYIFNLLNISKLVSFNNTRITITKHFRPLVFLTLCIFSTELYSRIDITMLGIMSNNVSVGYYTSAQRIVNIVMTLLVSSTYVLFPRLSELYQKDTQRFCSLVTNGTNLMIILTIPACIGLILIGKLVTTILFGAAFTEASISLQILSLIIPLRCIADITGYQIMLCAGQENRLAKTYFGIMLANISMNYLLIPNFKEIGASVASVISEALAFIIVFAMARQIVHISLNKLDFLKTILCAVTMGIVVFIISNNVENMYISLLLCMIVGSGTFIAGCRLLRNSTYIELRRILLGTLLKAGKRE